MASALPLNYTGRRHARLTRSMLRLPAAAQRVLCHLRYLIPDGETRRVTHAELARLTGYSAGYISAIVRYLLGEASTVHSSLSATPQHIFIARIPNPDGLGYLIQMLPPPELRRTEPTPPTSGGQGGGEASYVPPLAEQLSLFDHPGDRIPSDDASPSGPDEPQQNIDHQDDRRILLHACTEQQHAQPPAAGGGDDDQARETTAADAAEPPPRGVFPDAWQKMLIGTPGYTRAQFDQDLQVAHARGAGIGLVVRVISAGQRLLSQEDLHARRPAPTARRAAPDRPERLAPGAGRTGARPVGGAAAQLAESAFPPDVRTIDDIACYPGSAADWLRALRAERGLSGPPGTD